MTDYPDDILSRHIKPDHDAYTRMRTEKTSEAAEAAYQRFLARLRETVRPADPPLPWRRSEQGKPPVDPK